MSQIFHRHSNVYSRLSILALLVFGGALGAGIAALNWSGYNTNQGVFVEQPVQFSHAHHVGGMGIDCRYCHTSVEESAFANIPPTKTCMNCHSQIWINAPILEPVRASFRDGQASAVDARPRPSRLRVLQPQHSREAGRRLRHLPRTGRQDAPDVSAVDADDAVVPRLPSEPGEVRAAARPGLQHGLGTAQPTTPALASGW